MMYKIICVLIIFNFMGSIHILHASILTTGVETEYFNHTGDKKRITVKREVDPECQKIHISNDVFWEEEYASHNVSKACKSTFITTAGKTIFPMKLHEEIETYGELEVMTYIKQMQGDDTMLFIDTREEDWYEYRTIPGADNMHYVYLTMPKVFPEEFQASLAKLGIVKKDNSYVFSHVKTVLFFCNGAWCSQSPKMIKALLSLGYPAEKIKWYRGGMQTWLASGMTSTNNNTDRK